MLKFRRLNVFMEIVAILLTFFDYFVNLKHSNKLIFSRGLTIRNTFTSFSADPNAFLQLLLDFPSFNQTA